MLKIQLRKFVTTVGKQNHTKCTYKIVSKNVYINTNACTVYIFTALSSKGTLVMWVMSHTFTRMRISRPCEGSKCPSPSWMPSGLAKQFTLAILGIKGQTRKMLSGRIVARSNRLAGSCPSAVFLMFFHPKRFTKWTVHQLYWGR